MTAKGLFLPGYACTSQIWLPIRPELDSVYDLTWVDWPADVSAEFQDFEDFAHWLYATFWPGEYDFIVGHSLGGLAALQLAAGAKVLIPKIVLVETFLVPPRPFFQNLFSETISPEQERMIREMLDQEKVRYSSVLRNSLWKVDMSGQVAQLGKKIHVLYGDRGCGEARRVAAELAWPKALRANVEMSVVAGASHFPMVENPRETSCLLRRIIG